VNSWRERYDKSIREEAERIERAEAERTESEKFIDGSRWRQISSSSL